MDFERELLVEILSGNNTAQAFVKPEVMGYINAKLTHEDCLTCILVCKKDLQGILGCCKESVEKACEAVSDLLGLLCKKNSATSSNNRIKATHWLSCK